MMKGISVEWKNSSFLWKSLLNLSSTRLNQSSPVKNQVSSLIVHQKAGERFPLQSLEIHRDLISVYLLVMKILALLTGKISSQLSIISAAIQSFVKTPNDVPIVNQVVEIDLSRLDKNCGAESVCSSLFFHFTWIYERDDYVNHRQGFVFATKDIVKHRFEFVRTSNIPC